MGLKIPVYSALNKKKRTVIFTKLQDINPVPSTELEYGSPFELLVSVILSAQATDVSVNRATQALFRVANTPEGILKLGLRGLKGYIKTIGLYNAKGENIIKTCRILLEEYDGQVPESRDTLMRLPGVGRKTANVILNTAFGIPTIAVDTHVFQVANRTGIAPGKNVLEVERSLDKFVPDAFKQHAHHWLILHGRYICMARRPKCNECAISRECEWKDKKAYI